MARVAVASRPRLERRTRGRLVGGVAGGIADHLGLPVIAVRVAFVLLAAGTGLGVVLYAVYWIVLPRPGGVEAQPRRRVRDVLAVLAATVVGACTGVVLWRSLPFGPLVVPLVLAVLGGALIWRQAEDTDRTRWVEASRSSLLAQAHQRAGRLRLALGTGLVVLGAVTALARADPSQIGDAVVAVVVTVVGIAMVTGPWWVRLATDLAAERRERVRSQERAELATTVHDSVLQTLALIQRNAESPRTVARLARTQERQLRELLFGAPAGGAVRAALTAAAAEVEDDYGVTIDAVVVGEAPLDDAQAALVAAAREAMLNSAKHAGVEAVSLYAEVEPDVVSVYVKDRGRGFDLAAVPEDRQGVAGSIIQRVERHGGTAQVRTAPGDGTEVALRMPRRSVP